MPKFFVPMAWDNLAEAIKFRSQRPVGEDSSGKMKSSTTRNDLKSATSTRSSVNSGKVKSGRVNKRNRSQRLQTNTKVVMAEVPPIALPIGRKATTPKSKANNKRKQQRRKSQDSDDVEAQSSVSTCAVSEVASLESNVADEDIGLQVFENSLRYQLLGGRFRFINEQLYNMNSAEAKEFFKTNTDAFAAYHVGYQQQVRKWPLNPLDRVIKIIKRLPKSFKIVDFGCGEGKLAKSVPNKVYSLDLVSTRDDIIACDMAHTPLANESVDVAVYCLSLMGTNLKDYLLEANRVLRADGLVIIAEIQSRFDDIGRFIRSMEACGFEPVKKDEDEEIFYFLQFKKVRNVGKVAAIQPFSLKPCLYRKR